MKFKGRPLLKVLILMGATLLCGIAGFTALRVHESYNRMLIETATYLAFPGYALVAVVLLLGANTVFSTLTVSKTGIRVQKLFSRIDMRWDKIRRVNFYTRSENAGGYGSSVERYVDVYAEDDKLLYQFKTTYPDEALDCIISTAREQMIHTVEGKA